MPDIPPRIRIRRLCSQPVVRAGFLSLVAAAGATACFMAAADAPLPLWSLLAAGLAAGLVTTRAPVAADETLLQFFRDSRDIYHVCDPEGRLRVRSHGSVARAPAGEGATSWFDEVHPDDVSRARALLGSVASGRRIERSCRCRYRSEGGWESFSVRIERYPGAEPLLVIAAHPVSDPPRTTEDPATLRGFLDDLVETIPGCVYRYDAQLEKTTFISEKATEVLGRPPEFYLTDSDSWRVPIPAGERKRVAREIATAVAERTPLFELTYPYLRGDGSLITCRSRIRHTYDATGALTWVTGYTTDITHQLRIEEALRASEQHFRSLVEGGSEQVTVIDAESVIVYESPSVHQILGYVPEQMLDTVFLDYVHPNEHSTVAEACARVRLNPGWTEPVEYRFRHADGSWRHLDAIVHSRYEAGRDRVVVTARDVTERKQAEQELWDLTTALQNAAEGICRIDHEGRYVTTNQAYAEMFRTDPSQIIGALWVESIFPDDRPQLMNAYERMWAEEKAEVELRAQRRDGSVFFMRVTLVPASDANGALTGHHCFTKDVTEWRRMGAQLRQAQQLKAIGHLAAGVAHEINTPIQYIGDNIRFLEDGFRSLIGLVERHQEILAESAAGAADAEHVREAEAAAEQADLQYVREEVPRAIAQSLEGVENVASIVRAMKEFSHPGASEKSLVDINQAVASTITVARNEWKYVAFVETDLDPALPAILALPGDLNQALLNLLVNAAQAVEDVVGRDSGNRGSITVRTRQENDEWVRIEIEDTGPGIPPGVRDRIFDPFFTTKGVGRGTGQGLTLTHAVVVERHGGTLSFDTEMDRGTTFSVRLPIDSAAKQHSEAAV